MTTNMTDRARIAALEDRVAALEAQARAIPAAAPRDPLPGDEALFEALRAWRRERAEADGVKTFQVFGNAVLTAIAAAKPCDRFELQQIKGIGDQKFEQYGGEVIAIVRQHVDTDW